ncbi:MAG: sugar phosphate isomerase/epimerase family protein [Butyricicoccus sp.]
MKLAICTDVFADLSYTDMLDKVKSLGIDAVEMTAGGWGARKHCNTAELLADEGKRKEFMGELEKRGMRISALNTSCNPLWPSKTGEEYKKSMYDCATLAGLLGVKKIAAMAGLPAGSETDTTSNWITSTVSWPDFMAPAYEYQWKVTIEFWNEFIAHCKKWHRAHRYRGVPGHDGLVCFDPACCGSYRPDARHQPRPVRHDGSGEDLIGSRTCSRAAFSTFTARTLVSSAVWLTPTVCSSRVLLPSPLTAFGTMLQSAAARTCSGGRNSSPFAT